MSWQEIKLGEYFDITSSKRVFQADWKDSGIPFYRAREVVKLAKDGFVNNELFISHEMYEKYSEKYGAPTAGDLLVTGVGTLGKVYIVKENDKFYFKDGNIIWLKKKTDINSKFVEYAFKTKEVQRYIQNSPGATVGTYTIIKAKETVIPLPPLAVQQKIASVLDAADNLRQKDQQLIDKYNELSQSLFLDMFGDPVGNPMGWKIVAFAESIVKIVGGKSVGGEQRQIEPNEKAVLKISAVTSGKFNHCEYKVVAKSEIPTDLIYPQKGDLLFSRANTREMVGATCIVDKDYKSLFLPDKLWRLDLKSNVTSNWYIKFLLTHDGFRENLRKVATGTSGSMLNISKEKLKRLQIPLPPTTLQNQFAERILAIEAQKQQALASLQKSEDLFNSLLQRAFKGELTH